MSSYGAGPQASPRDDSCPSTEPSPVAGATQGLRSGLSGSQRATCPGPMVWTSLPSPAGPVAFMLTQEWRDTVRRERRGRACLLWFGGKMSDELWKGGGRAVGSGGCRGGQHSHDNPGGRCRNHLWGRALLQPHEKFPAELLNDGIYLPPRIVTI